MQQEYNPFPLERKSLTPTAPSLSSTPGIICFRESGPHYPHLTMRTP